MDTIQNIEEMRNLIEAEPFVLFYLSRPACGVCHAIKPKVADMASRHPSLKAIDVNLDDDERIAGQFSIFTIPAVLGFLHGKEFLREARYMAMDDMAAQLKRLASFVD